MSLTPKSDDNLLRKVDPAGPKGRPVVLEMSMVFTLALLVMIVATMVFGEDPGQACMNSCARNYSTSEAVCHLGCWLSWP